MQRMLFLMPKRQSTEGKKVTKLRKLTTRLIADSKINKSVSMLMVRVSTLLTFAAERRPAACPLLSTDRSPTPALPANSSKVCCYWLMLVQTDGQTDRRTPYHFIDPAAYYASSDNKVYNEVSLMHTCLSEILNKSQVSVA